MNRNLLSLVLAASLALGLYAGTARAQVDGFPIYYNIENGCYSPPDRAYDIMSEFNPFGFPPKECRQLCKVNLHLCQNLIQLDLRCLIEELNANDAYWALWCEEFTDNKQDLKDCLKENKTIAGEVRHEIKAIIPESKHNCADSWNYCRSNCD